MTTKVVQTSNTCNRTQTFLRAGQFPNFNAIDESYVLVERELMEDDFFKLLYKLYFVISS